MANITIPNVNFVPEIWAQRALQALRANIVMARHVYRDSDIAAFTEGAKLHIPVPGTFVANTKAAGSPVTKQVPTDSKVDVTLDTHKEVTFVIEDILKVQANQDLMDRYLKNATIPLAEEIENALFGLYASVTASIGTDATDLSAATLRTARKTLNDNKAPKAGRVMVISDKDEIALLGDSSLERYFANSRPEAVAEGSLGRVYGFDIYQSQLVPLVSTSTKNMAFAPEAFILAMRGMPESGAPGVSQMSISDPESGLALRQTVSYDTDALGMKVTLDVLFGVSLLRDAAAVVVKS